MRSQLSAQTEGQYVRCATRWEGLFFDDFSPESAWIKEEAQLHLPALAALKQICVIGETRIHPEVLGPEVGIPEMDVFLNDQHIATVAVTSSQGWEVRIDVPPERAANGATIKFRLRGVNYTNTLAWLARIAESWPMSDKIQRFRRQNKNRQMRITRVEADGEIAFDFSNRHAPYSAAFARAHSRLGINIVGFITADLGIGESARAMIRAADAVKIPAAAVPLKLHCKARLGDQTFAAFVQDHNPHAVNVFHLDAPASRDIDTHHGHEFRSGKYNIGYWAWELPEFPDAWLSYFEFFQEIWCPSEFVRQAIAAKSPLPVVVMPHAVEFPRPTEPIPKLREHFSLPPDKFLFLFLYDLNSYTERKNPRAVLEAFKRSGLADKNAALVIKVHGVHGNEHEWERLRGAVAEFPGTTLVSESLSRAKVYELEAACDCFVSLHRSEGFGFAIAECMYLGKPVIATNWSAPSEFINSSNSAPVGFNLVTLEKNHGPYAKGQIWAEPSIDEAATWMKRLHSDKALCLRLGEAAKATVERQFSFQAVGARYRQRLEAIASW